MQRAEAHSKKVRFSVLIWNWNRTYSDFLNSVLFMNKDGSLPRKTLLFWKMFGVLWNCKHSINFKNSSDTGLFRKENTRIPFTGYYSRDF